MKNKRILWLMLAISLIGILDSFYLTLTHLMGGEVACTIVEGCDLVLSSTYSQIGPFPTAGLGVLFYIIVFYTLLTILSGRGGETLQSKLKMFLGLGFLSSIFFLYLQAFVIGAYCQYCLLSLITSTALFSLSFFIDKRNTENNGG